MTAQYGVMAVNYSSILTPRKIRGKITMVIYRSFLITLDPGDSMDLRYVLQPIFNEKSQNCPNLGNH
jgi:hypothetical protein